MAESSNLILAYLKYMVLPDHIKELHHIKLEAKIPRLDLVAYSGYYAPLASATSKKGFQYINLCQTTGVIDSSDKRRAALFLQIYHTAAKASVNVSSLYLLDADDSQDVLIGFGNPNPNKKIAKVKQNPFYPHRNDGFLFVVSKDYSTIEMLILKDQALTILGHAQALADGRFDEALQKLRASATLKDYSQDV